MQIRTFFLNLGIPISILKQLNIPWKDLFKRNKNVKKHFFRSFSEKHCILTLNEKAEYLKFLPVSLLSKKKPF